MNTAEIEFRRSGGGETQTDRLARYLERRAGRWVAMPRLAEIIGGYAVHSRIADCRRRGMQIENRTRVYRGKRWSFYRVVKQEGAVK